MFTAQAMDSKGNTGSLTFTLTVQIFVSESGPSTINSTLSPNATAGILYSNTIQQYGAVGAVTWSSTSGALPPGSFTLTTGAGGNGVLSGTPSTAGTYVFTAQAMDSKGNTGSLAFTLTVLIFVSDTGAPAVTTNLPAGAVGSPYSNTIDEVGGTAPLAWSITAGVLPPGLSLGPNSGTVSGTPTAPGKYNFTVQVTDSASPQNVATLAFMLSVADAQYGDLIVVDGAPTASPLGGTLFRITPSGTAGTIAAISNGSPTGVAVDPASGNIYAAVAPVGESGTARIVQIGPFGAVTDPFNSGGAALQNPVAVAVDASGNVYVGDNSTNAIYEFNSSGAPVGAVPFASLPSSNSVPNHIRMAFDSSGNLDVVSDNVGGTAGVVEVDQIASNGTLTVLYNTTTKSTATYTLTAASAVDVNGNTTYAGTFSPTIPANAVVTIAGFTNATNNGPFTVVSCSSNSLVVVNGGGTAETNPGTATLQLTAIGTVGGIAAFSDGSIDVADYGAQTIYKITNPGMTNMAITADISATSALCCNMSGMANPPGTTLYVTLTGLNNGPRLQAAVPQTNIVTTVNSTYALTAASAASGGNTTYTGTFSPTIPVGSLVTITGFTNATNNGTFTVVSCSSTQLVVNNGSGIAETNPGIAVTAPLTFPNDVAWYDYPPPG
jgi:hypothetical protein